MEVDNYEKILDWEDIWLAKRITLVDKLIREGSIFFKITKLPYNVPIIKRTLESLSYNELTLKGSSLLTNSVQRLKYKMPMLVMLWRSMMKRRMLG